MIISDLNHVEVVSEETETSIVGGASSIFSYKVPNFGLPVFAGPNGVGTYTSVFTSKTNQSGSGASSTGSILTSVTISYW